MYRNRRGFTFVELLMVITIIGIIASIALPKFRDMRRRATATQLLGDFDVLRHAALSFYVDSGYFPTEADRGEMPRNLSSYLPNGFAMAKSQWSMDYQNWEVPRGTRYSKEGATVGVSFVTPDPRLGMTAMRLAGNRPGFMLGQSYTFLMTF